MQKKKQRLSLMERLRRGSLGWMLRKKEISATREYTRWANGWKRHCATRSQIRRIGSRQRAIELGIVTA